jgi:putative SOS response-associated peptidase YedK
MCGRYSLSSPAQLVQEVFELATTPELEARWNVAPTQEAAVVRAADGRRRLDLLRWGLVPESSDGPGSGPLHVNARSETAASLPAFRDSFRHRRCLVPADGFYEWAKGPAGRQAFHIRRSDRAPFAMAGLWSVWRPPQDERSPLESFTILTCPPAVTVRPLHDRMPVILPREAWEAWLTPEQPPWRLRKLLAPYRGELVAVPVGPFVNHAANEGPECVREVAPAAPAQRSLF